MIWLALKIIFYIILFVISVIFINGFMIGFKEATQRFFNYSVKHLVPKKNNDGLVYELERAEKEYKI